MIAQHQNRAEQIWFWKVKMVQFDTSDLKEFWFMIFFFFSPFQGIQNFFCIVLGNEQEEKKVSIQASDPHVCTHGCLHSHTIWAGMFLEMMAGGGITVSRSMTEKSQLEITFPCVLSSSVFSACAGRIFSSFFLLRSLGHPPPLGSALGTGLRVGMVRPWAPAEGGLSLSVPSPLPEPGMTDPSPEHVRRIAECCVTPFCFPATQKSTCTDRSVSVPAVIIHCALFTRCEIKLKSLWHDEGIHYLACMFRQKHIHGNEIWTCNSNW